MRSSPRFRRLVTLRIRRSPGWPADTVKGPDESRFLVEDALRPEQVVRVTAADLEAHVSSVNRARQHMARGAAHPPARHNDVKPRFFWAPRRHRSCQVVMLVQTTSSWADGRTFVMPNGDSRILTLRWSAGARRSPAQVGRGRADKRRSAGTFRRRHPGSNSRRIAHAWPLAPVLASAPMKSPP
jgi:hypothetical protein